MIDTVCKGPNDVQITEVGVSLSELLYHVYVEVRNNTVCRMGVRLTRRRMTSGISPTSSLSQSTSSLGASWKWASR